MSLRNVAEGAYASYHPCVSITFLHGSLLLSRAIPSSQNFNASAGMSGGAKRPRQCRTATSILIERHVGTFAHSPPSRSGEETDSARTCPERTSGAISEIGVDNAPT